MPAVAQIAVNFCQRSEIQNLQKIELPTNVKSVNPRTLTQFLLYNRELQAEGENFGLFTPSNLSYAGGFITAGDLINVKHDSDLQLRKNLEVGNYVQSDFLIGRTKGTTYNNTIGINDYEDTRTDSLRTVTISPRQTELNNTFIKIYSDGTTNSNISQKEVSIYTLRNNVESFLRVTNTLTNQSIRLKSPNLNVIAPTITLIGVDSTPVTDCSVTITGTVTISNLTTVNNTVKIKDDLEIGTASYNQFKVTGATGTVEHTGNLTIATNKFKVTSSDGKTEIAGDLNVGILVNPQGTTPGTFNYSKFTVDSATGNTYAHGTLTVNEKLTVTADSQITGTLTIDTNLVVEKDSTLKGDVEIQKDLTLKGFLDVTGTTTLSGDTQIKEDLRVNKTARVDGNVTVIGTSTFSNSLTFDTGTATAASRRVTGVRRLASHAELLDTNRASDALTYGDFVEKVYGTGVARVLTIGQSPYTVVQADDQQTILVDNDTSNFEIVLPSTLREGTQVSFIRLGAGGKVFFSGTTRSAPTNSFTRLAFRYSVATAFEGSGNIWYLFGDLLPNT